MKQLRSNKIKLTVFGVVFCSSFALLPLQARQPSETLNNGQESSEVVIMISGEEHRYQPRPDLGYVIMAQENADTITSIKSNFDLFTRQEVNYIGGRGRQGLRIVESKQSATPNEAAIKTLSVQKQFQYVAPLFSCNGSKIAVIPEVVVRVTSGIREDQLQSLCREIGCAIIKPMEFTTQEYLLGVQGSNAEAVFMAVEQLNEIDWIEWASPNIAFSPKPCGLVIPIDEYFPLQWHLHNTGQSGGTPGADINAPAAWEITTGDPNIVVAVLDTGVDSSHPDLVNNLVPGYDFYDDDDLPDPVGGSIPAHGTCCAGLIAAEGNNSIGVVGVTWKCKIMPIRTYMWGGWGDTPESEIATAIRWSAVHGADVLSNSWGDNMPLPIIHSAFVDVTQKDGIGRDGKGCIVLCASGNNNSRATPPASFPEVVAVGATDNSDEHWYYSNYGPELDIVAPSGPRRGEAGMYIWTTDITGNRGFNMYNRDPSILDYCDFGGTSGACPIAAGIAALILSIEPELTNEEVRHFLERSAKDLGEPGRDDYYGWGRVDAWAALDMVLAKRCDLNNDWEVDDHDLAMLNAAIDTNDLSADIAPPAKRDGVVDELDLDLLMQYWGTEIPEPGLIARWKLDETEGMFTADSVGENNAIVVGSATWQPSGGMIAGALQLDGIDDYVSTPYILSPTDGDFSVFAWIKGGAPGQVIISQENGANWLMADSIDGALKTDLKQPEIPNRNPIPQGPPLTSSIVITDGFWHRVGFVRNGRERILYVDDIEIARDTATYLKKADGGLHIGAGNNLEPGTFWSGLIDDVRIYNRAVNP
jgi:subtilisin family serine protease